MVRRESEFWEGEFWIFLARFEVRKGDYGAKREVGVNGKVIALQQSVSMQRTNILVQLRN